MSLDSDIRLGYYPRSTFVGLFKQYFDYGVGRSRTVRRHPRSLRLRQLAVPVHVGWTLLAALLGPWFTLPLVWPALYLGALVATSLGFATRRRSFCGLLAGPAAGVMHTAWGCGFLLGLALRRERRWRRRMVVPLWDAASLANPT